MDPRLLTNESAHFSQQISDFDLYAAYPDIVKYTSTLINNVAGQVDISVKYYQELKGKTRYHQYDHSANIENGIDSIFLNVDSDDVFEIRRELDTYNTTRNEDSKLDSFEELFGILKIFAATHDLGHSFDLHPEIKRLMQRHDISVADFEKALSELTIDGKPLGATAFLVELEQSNEKGAEDRSKAIAAFLLKHSLSIQIQASSGNGKNMSIDFDTTFRKYREIIDHLINLTIYTQNEENTEPFAQIIRFLDRVMPYVGKREVDKVRLINALCEEKEAENIEGYITILFALNFPWLEFHKLFKERSRKTRILEYFAGIDTKLGTDYERGIGKFYTKEDFPSLDVDRPLTWKELYDLLNRQDIIDIISKFDIKRLL